MVHYTPAAPFARAWEIRITKPHSLMTLGPGALYSTMALPVTQDTAPSTGLLLHATWALLMPRLLARLRRHRGPFPKHPGGEAAGR